MLLYEHDFKTLRCGSHELQWSILLSSMRLKLH